MGSWLPPKIRLPDSCLRWLAALAIALSAAACGGGGGDAAGPAPAPLAAMADSFGRQLAEAEFGQGDSRAAGVDGTAAEGAALANAPVTITDSNGRVASGLTDGQGYYRLRVDDFVAPLVGSVTRPDGSAWRAVSVAAVRPRAFLTLNLTPLTDKLASDIAVAAGQAGSARLTPAMVAANPGALPAALQRLRELLQAQIAGAGLQLSSFDPGAQPFRPDRTGMDAVLELMQAGRDATGATTLAPKVPPAGRGGAEPPAIPAMTLGGTVAGLTTPGLVLWSGGQALAVPAGATSFTFPVPFAAGSDVVVTLGVQPSGEVCTVVNGAGRIGGATAMAVHVACEPRTYSVAVAVTGPSGSGDLQLSFAGETFTIPAAGFVFPQRLRLGSGYTVAVVKQPTDFFVHFQIPATYRCTIPEASGVIAGDTVVTVVCEALWRFDVEVKDLTGVGLVVGLGRGDTLAITPSGGARSFGQFPTLYTAGASYTATIVQQPAGNSCTILNPTGQFRPLTSIYTVPMPGFLQVSCMPG